MSEDKKKREPRRLIPEREAGIIMPRKRGATGSILIPSVPDLLDDGLSILATEITNYKMLARQRRLDSKEARILQGYLQALVSMSKESREHDDDRDLANMTDEELIDLVETIREKRSKEQEND